MPHTQHDTRYIDMANMATDKERCTYMEGETELQEDDEAAGRNEHTAHATLVKYPPAAPSTTTP